MHRYVHEYTPTKTIREKKLPVNFKPHKYTQISLRHTLINTQRKNSC